MAKKIVAVIKLALQAGKANPAPPVGPALGQHGVNIMAFCKEYNARTQEKAGYVIPVEISVFEDRSFTFITKTPPASVLITKAAGIEKGAATSAEGGGGCHFPCPARGDRQDQAARPQLHQCGVGHAHHRRHRPQHGRRRKRLIPTNPD